MEYERVIVNWIEYKAKWWKSCTKKELNWDKNDKIDTCKCLWGIKMMIIFDHLIQESGEERQFGHLPKMCCDLPCQIDALT